MKEELVIKMNVVKEHGANAAVVLAVVNKSADKVSNSDIAREVGISFPTAQKILSELAEKGLIKQCGKMYSKI